MFSYQNAIYTLISSMHTQHSDLSDRADSLTTAFEAVQSQVSSLQTDLAIFAFSQNNTMNDFRSDLEGARAIAAAFSESLSSLSVSSVAAILESAWMTAQGVGIMLLVVAVHWIAGKVAARVVAAVCGCLTVGKALASADVDRIISPIVATDTPLVIFLSVAIAFFGIVFYYLRKVLRTNVNQQKEDRDLHMPGEIARKGKLLP
jgi:hypothetical protein